jgi:diguanylate cyclase (GGDEF)-like protein
MKRNKLVLWFSVVVFCSLLLSTITALFTIHKISQAHTEEFLQTMSYDVERSIHDPLSETIIVSRAVANDSLLIELLGHEEELGLEQTGAQIAAYTERLRESFGYSWVFVVSDASMGYYTNEGLYRVLDPQNEADDAWYADFVQSGEEYTVMIGQDNDRSGAWTIFADMRIESEDGEFLGVCGMALELPGLQQRLREYEAQYAMRVTFVDAAGLEQLSSEGRGDAPRIIDLPPEAQEQEFAVTQTAWNGNCTVTRYLEELDWYMIMEDLNPYDYTSDYLLIAANIAIFAVFLVLAMLALYYILKQEQVLLERSYQDKLTGVLNRRAYEEDLALLREGEVPGTLWVLAFDVNGLKQVNDTVGHAAGDKMIAAAAGLIRRCFAPYGKCYRTGGDEFVAVLDKRVEDLAALLRQFEAEVERWQGEQVGSLDIACGAACAADHPDGSIDELVFLADEEMYRKKREYYAQPEHERRRGK